MKKYLIALLVLFSQMTYSQPMTWRLQSRVYINGNPNFKIKYGSNETVKLEDNLRTVDLGGKELNSLKSVKKGWSSITDFDPAKYPVLSNRKYLYADLVQSEDKAKVYILFWPFSVSQKQESGTSDTLKPSTNFDQAIKAGSFYIELPVRTPLAFKTEAWHAGPLTMPFKVYLSSRDDDHTSNASAEVNAGLYIGKKSGWKSFSNMPAEKEGKINQGYHSFNFIFGFSNTDVTTKNSIDSSTKEGTVLSASPGVAYGIQYNLFSVFIGAGVDLPFSNSVADKWRYKGQPWLGFGLGFAIFK